MKKEELIATIATSAGIKKNAAEKVFNDMKAAIVEALKKGEEVAFGNDFGKFETKEKPARKGRNPKTGEELMIAAKTVVKFKPSKKILASE